MAYVDLNPVRANIVKRVEAAHHTSVKHRIEQKSEEPSVLGNLSRLGVSLNEYVDVLRWTAGVDGGNTQAHSQQALRTLAHLHQGPDTWLGLVQVNRFKYRAYGAATRLKQYARALGQRWIKSAPSGLQVT